MSPRTTLVFAAGETDQIAGVEPEVKALPVFILFSKVSRVRQMPTKMERSPQELQGA